MPVDPTLEVERSLLQTAPLIIGVDEVGRGAIAGPVAVGAAAMRAEQALSEPPEGLRDSKALSEKRREALIEPINAWVETSVGFATALEIDSLGIVDSLALAAGRALDALARKGVEVQAATVLLDGTHNWLNAEVAARIGYEAPHSVVVRAKADRDAALVSAASVVAKVVRDAHMRELAVDYPVYAWERNKGYGSRAHRDAIAAHGPCAWHRRTWLH